jgi:glycosyltransferase involved in cell wall biosynthesis
MKNKFSILVANNHLVQVGGSETFTYTMIKELLSRDFDVEYFALVRGDFSEKLEKELNVKFKSKKKYDLILANHNTCVEALMGYGFIIQTCHGIYPQLEQPSICANFHVAISQEVQNHLAIKGFVSVIIMNGIDNSKFYSKKSINKELKNVLSLCQSEEANLFLKKICNNLNLKFTSIDKNSNPTWNIEDVINDSDLVIGLGRSAYEAMACGRPVIVFDKRAYSESYADGYVTNKLATSIINNCSGRFYKIKITDEIMVQELSKYNAADGEILRQYILDNMTVKFAVERYLNLFDSLHSNINFSNKKYYLKFLQREFYVRNIKKILLFKRIG